MILFLSGIFGRLSTMLYYYIYVLENVNIVAPISSILSISLILPVLFVPTLIKKFDIKNVMTASALLCSFGCLLIWIFGRTNTLVLVIATIILGAGNWISLCSGPLVAEIIDAIQIKHLIRIEGTVYSCISFTTKLGNTIGATVGILLLAAVGYTANEVQSESVKEGMNIIVNLVPAILFLASALFFYFITLTNKKGDENTKIIKEIFGLQGGNDEEK